MELSLISDRLTELLQLDSPPVSVALTSAPPSEIANARRAVPSACSFWREAEQGAFYASAADHFNCPLGAMVMGFELPGPVAEQLGGLVESMCGQGYVTADEPASIPTMPGKSTGAVYGPLGGFPVKPDVVLIWLTPRQAMIFAEAAGGVNWAAADLMGVSGRPGCATIPLSLEREQPRLSLGCAGMRTFTRVGDDRMLAAVPGDQIERFVAALERTVGVNAAMGSYYQGQAAQFG